MKRVWTKKKGETLKKNIGLQSRDRWLPVELYWTIQRAGVEDKIPMAINRTGINSTVRMVWWAVQQSINTSQSSEETRKHPGLDVVSTNTYTVSTWEPLYNHSKHPDATWSFSIHRSTISCPKLALAQGTFWISTYCTHLHRLIFENHYALWHCD